MTAVASITPIGLRSGQGTRPGLEVVAMVLSDGSVVEVPDSPRQRAAGDAGRRMANGTLSGGDWTLWWERRVY